MPNPKALTWEELETPAELKPLLNGIGKFYSISKGKVAGAIAVEFKNGGPESTVQVILRDAHTRFSQQQQHL